MERVPIKIEHSGILRETLASKRRVLGENFELDTYFSYNLACLAAVLGHRADAFANLRQALDYGYRGAEIANDEDLKSLHGDPRFDAILAEVKRLAAAAK